MSSRGSRKQASDAALPLDVLPPPAVAVEQTPVAERTAPEAAVPAAGRTGFLRRRVREHLGAHGYSVDGFPRADWKPGDVGDFRQHVVDSTPWIFEEV